jgi:hypothetical protein
MCGIIYIENKERRKNKCQRNIGQVAPTAEQILNIVLLLMMTMMRMKFIVLEEANVLTAARNGSGKRSLSFLKFASSKRFEKKRTIEILTFMRMYDII